MYASIPTSYTKFNDTPLIIDRSKICSSEIVKTIRGEEVIIVVDSDRAF